MLHFSDPNGNRIDPAEMEGMPPGIPNGVPHAITFRPIAGGRTALTAQEFGYTTRDALETSKAGLDQVLEKLRAHLQRGVPRQGA